MGKLRGRSVASANCDRERRRLAQDAMIALGLGHNPRIGVNPSRISVGGFGGCGSYGGADGEPLCGAGDTAEYRATFRGAKGIGQFPAHGGGLDLFVFQVGLGGG